MSCLQGTDSFGRK